MNLRQEWIEWVKKQHISPLFGISFDESFAQFYSLSNFIQENDLKESAILHSQQTRALRLKNAKSCLWGGYLEKRACYQSPLFLDQSEPRNYHLGIDFWVEANTPIYAPLQAKVVGLANNNSLLDYGPTLILAHQWMDNQFFYTLYGHLSTQSLDLWKIGDQVAPGACIGYAGTIHENGCWAEHVHFQIIMDMLSFQNDFPGVCSFSDLEYFEGICPDPMFLVK